MSQREDGWTFTVSTVANSGEIWLNIASPWGGKEGYMLAEEDAKDLMSQLQGAIDVVELLRIRREQLSASVAPSWNLMLQSKYGDR